jgi:hypothetical protein
VCFCLCNNDSSIFVCVCVCVCGVAGREVIRLRTDPENRGTGAYLGAYLMASYTHGGASCGF